MTTDLSSGTIHDCDWNAPVVTPGRAIELSCRLEGFAEAPEPVTFTVHAHTGRTPSAASLATLTATVSAARATATWTPPETGLPVRVSFQVEAGSARANGPTRDVDLGDLVDPSWTPDVAERGGRVRLSVTARGFPAGQRVRFRIFEDDTASEDDFVAEVTANTGSGGATSVQWTVPQALDADGEEGAGEIKSPEYYFVAELAGNSVTSPILPVRSCIDEVPEPSQALLDRPARDLNLTDARTIVLSLLKHGRIALARDRVQFRGRYPNCGECTSPRPTDHLALRGTILTPDGPVAVLPAHGVTSFQNAVDSLADVPHAEGSSGGGSTYQVPQGQRLVDNLDMRMVVFLYRLAAWLRSEWGVDAIYHLGIGHGSDSHSPWNCHNAGRAMDFAGIMGRKTFEGQAYQYRFTVLRDWGQAPVPTGGNQWRAAETNTSYRLAPLAEQDHARWGLRAAIFQSIYEWMTRQAVDASQRRGASQTPSTIGHASFIVNPDHPQPGLRDAHRDHYHVQVGPTEWENPAPVDDTATYRPGPHFGGRPPEDELARHSGWAEWAERHPPSQAH